LFFQKIINKEILIAKLVALNKKRLKTLKVLIFGMAAAKKLLALEKLIHLALLAKNQ
jgi:hypothetical protein